MHTSVSSLTAVINMTRACAWRYSTDLRCSPSLSLNFELRATNATSISRHSCAIHSGIRGHTFCKHTKQRKSSTRVFTYDIGADIDAMVSGQAKEKHFAHMHERSPQKGRIFRHKSPSIVDSSKNPRAHSYAGNTLHEPTNSETLTTK